MHSYFCRVASTTSPTSTVHCLSAYLKIYQIYSVILVSKFSFSFLPQLPLDFGTPKVLFLNFSFRFGINIVQLTFNLQCTFEKDHVVNFKTFCVNIAQFLPVMPNLDFVNLIQ